MVLVEEVDEDTEGEPDFGNRPGVGAASDAARRRPTTAGTADWIELKDRRRRTRGGMPSIDFTRSIVFRRKFVAVRSAKWATAFAGAASFFNTVGACLHSAADAFVDTGSESSLSEVDAWISSGSSH